jgi:hypothetical protein
MEDFERPAEDPVDQDLDFSRSKRISVINYLTAKGVPDDDNRIALLLGALNDMDRTSLGKKRIKVDSDTTASNKQAADLIASIFNKPDSKKLGTTVLDGIVGKIPDQNVTLPNVEILPGEMAVNPPQLDYDTFMGSNQK